MLSRDQFPGYQVLPEAVQPRVLDFPSLLDYHEGEDTEKSCNLKHRRCVKKELNNEETEQFQSQLIEHSQKLFK